MARRKLTSEQKLTEALRQAQAIVELEKSGLNDFYRVQRNDGTYTYNKIPQVDRSPTEEIDTDTLIALTHADLLTSGASKRVPDTSLAARTPRAELVEALKTLKFLSAGSPLNELQYWGMHGDYEGRKKAGTFRDIQMALISDMDNGVNPRTGAPLGKPFTIKFKDANGVEQEALVRNTIQGGHILGATEYPGSKHNPSNIVAEPYVENNLTAGREPSLQRDGLIMRQINTDEDILFNASQVFQANEESNPKRYIAEMSKLAKEKPELKPRLTHLFNRMGFELN